jgi:hypothetical protein
MVSKYVVSAHIYLWPMYAVEPGLSYLHLVPILGETGAIRPLPLYMPSWFAQGELKLVPVLSLYHNQVLNSANECSFPNVFLSLLVPPTVRIDFPFLASSRPSPYPHPPHNMFCPIGSLQPPNLPFPCLMLYIFCAVDYYTGLSIKPTTAQLRLYQLRHVSDITIRPSSGRMYFLKSSVCTICCFVKKIFC